MTDLHGLNIPASWKDVKLDSFQELMLCEDSLLSDKRKIVERIAILCNVDSVTILKLKPKQILEIAEALSFTNSFPEDTYDFGSYKLRKFNDLTVGEWIDLDAYVTKFYSNSHLILAILFNEEAYDLNTIGSKGLKIKLELDTQLAYTVLRKFLAHREAFYTEFKMLFEQPGSKDSTEEAEYKDETPAQRRKREREDIIIQKNREATNWWNFLDTLANGDPLKYEEVTNLKITFAFKYLQFKRWKEKTKQ